MIFNSLTFLLFLCIVVTLYWILPAKVKMWMLLIASCVFYGFWKWEYLSIMFISAMTDYYTAIAIGNTSVERKIKRKTLLSITLIVNLGLLCYFKYLMFFTANVNDVFHFLGSSYRFPLLKIILPFGISFYTFETISYTVDVYRGLIKPEKSFLNYALFVTFFPKLVAGPIQRASSLLEQLKNRPVFSRSFVGEGLKRILFGLFLKVVIADNISPLVDEGFGMNPNSLYPLDVWTLAFLFGFQIYFDFSAYSHIAVGAAKLMGINIPENFNFPYVANSFKDFWKRWHISLSSWIRDYLYLPLCGIKVVQNAGTGGMGEGLEKTNASKNKKDVALFITWAIMGLWHGANWTFVFWGLYHATFVFLERKIKIFIKFPLLNNNLFGWILTLPLAMLSWVPFRAKNLADTFIMLKKIFLIGNYKYLGMRENIYLVTAIIMILFLITYWIDKKLAPLIEKYYYLSLAINTVKYTIMCLLIFTFLRPISQFIYFQF